MEPRGAAGGFREMTAVIIVEGFRLPAEHLSREGPLRLSTTPQDAIAERPL
jgi:hypothetical protein